MYSTISRWTREISVEEIQSPLSKRVVDFKDHLLEHMIPIIYVPE